VHAANININIYIYINIKLSIYLFIYIHLQVHSHTYNVGETMQTMDGTYHSADHLPYIIFIMAVKVQMAYDRLSLADHDPLVPHGHRGR
jgi:hypothetical protein